MRISVKNLLVSELASSSTYLNRIYHALYDLSSMINHPKTKEIAEKLYFDVTTLFETDLFPNELINKNPTLILPKSIREQIKAYSKLLESLLTLNLDEEKTIKLTVDFINILYSSAYPFHKIVTKETNLEIQYPRLNLTSMVYPEDAELENQHIKVVKGEKDIKNDPTRIPKFNLSFEAVMNCFEANANIIDSLDFQRNKRYEDLIQQGHDAIFYKKNATALEKFKKAMNYKETAEVLTLIGWVYSLIGDSDQAKSYCLKAIQIDPDYGPPYNDLGSYLLAEGQVNESFKWFDLAKKAPDYQNREYPYINSGRAHISQKNFKLALEEFSKALTLAPYHEELHNTVQKLKDSLDKNSKDFDDMTVSDTLNDEWPIYE